MLLHKQLHPRPEVRDKLLALFNPCQSVFGCNDIDLGLQLIGCNAVIYVNRWSALIYILKVRCS